MDDAPRGEPLSLLEQRLQATRSIHTMERVIEDPSRPDVPWGAREAWMGIAINAALTLTAWGGVPYLAKRYHLPFGPLPLFLTMQTLTLVISWWLTIRRHRASLATLGFRWFEPQYLAAPYVIMMLVVLFGIFYGGILYAFGIHPHNGLPAWGRDFAEVFRRYNDAVIFCAFTFVAPFCEEVTDRSFILQGLARSHGWRVAGFVSALFWALTHVQALAIAPIFVLGLMLASLFRRCRSIWPCLFTHMLINGMVTSGLIMRAQGLVDPPRGG